MNKRHGGGVTSDVRSVFVQMVTPPHKYLSDICVLEITEWESEYAEVHKGKENSWETLNSHVKHNF